VPSSIGVWPAPLTICSRRDWRGVPSVVSFVSVVLAVNWVVVRYTDAEGITRYVTPDDDASLTDATSVTDYGHRELPSPGYIDCGNVSQASAIEWGTRYLAQAKDPRYYITAPITLVDWIRAKNGSRAPVTNVRAGERVKLEDFVNDEVNVSGAGMTFIITGTTYNDADRTIALALGVPDSLPVWLAQLAAGMLR